MQEQLLSTLFIVLLIGAIILAVAVAFYFTIFIIASAILKPYKLKREIDERYYDEKRELEEIILKQANEQEDYLKLLKESNTARLEFEQVRQDLLKVTEQKDKAELELAKTKRKLNAEIKKAV